MKNSNSKNQTKMDLAFVSSVLAHAKMLGPKITKSVAVKIGTDSRTAGPGEVFVALKGDRFDGHDFLDAVMRAGVSAIVCDQSRVPNAPSVPCFAVDDPLLAYRELAGAWRGQFAIPVVCVAGSVGKTTTKEFLAALLSVAFRVPLKTQASENGFIGIPRTLLRLGEEHGAAVIEVGIDEVGAMQQHLELVKPTHSVVTKIAEEHLEKLIDLPTVAREERLALSYVQTQGGRVSVSADDPYLLPVLERRGETATLVYGMGERDDLDLRGVYDAGQSRLRVIESKKEFTFDCPLLGGHNAANLLAAVAVARSMRVSFEKMAEGLKNFIPPTGRSHIAKLKNGTEILCDYYNANPSSMESAFELIEALRQGQRRQVIACLADMLELGPAEESLHRGLAKSIVKNKFNEVWLFGPRMRWLSEELGKQDFEGKVAHFDDMAKLQAALVKSLRGEPLVLIKGSRGMKMERVFEALEKA